MNDQAAFEAAIDANPLEATTHLVYADWLEENGHHDEAAFRRAMGKWAQWATQADGIHHPEENEHFPYTYPLNPTDVNYNREKALPEGVPYEHLRVWNHLNPTENIEHADESVTPRDPTQYHYYGGRHRWQTYRNMEDAFRHAFMEHRRQLPQHFARALNTIPKSVIDIALCCRAVCEEGSRRIAGVTERSEGTNWPQSPTD